MPGPDLLQKLQNMGCPFVPCLEALPGTPLQLNFPYQLGSGEGLSTPGLRGCVTPPQVLGTRRGSRSLSHRPAQLGCPRGPAAHPVPFSLLGGP